MLMMRPLLRVPSLALGGLGITCFICSFWVPAAGGQAFVMRHEFGVFVFGQIRQGHQPDYGNGSQ